MPHLSSTYPGHSYLNQPSNDLFKVRMLVPDSADEGSQSEDSNQTNAHRETVRETSPFTLDLACTRFNSEWLGRLPLNSGIVSTDASAEEGEEVVLNSEDDSCSVDLAARTDTTVQTGTGTKLAGGTSSSLNTSQDMVQQGNGADQQTDEMLSRPHGSQLTQLSQDDTLAPKKDILVQNPSAEQLVSPQSPPMSEFAASFFERQEAPVVRSYPLRQRTFQQRMPYTADKQHHARLIGSRGISVKPILSGENARGHDLAVVEQQDSDSSDSSYEEPPAPQHQSRAGLPTAQDTIANPSSSWYPFEDMDEDMDEDMEEDDLPTLNRHRHHHVQQPLPSLKIPKALSNNAKRRLKRLARQRIEPLEPVDLSPPNSTLINQTTFQQFEEVLVGDTPQGSVEREIASLSGSDSAESDGQRARTGEAVDMLSDTSDTNNAEELSRITKRSNRYRQHVLPMVFFKRNFLPDDAAALKSMRSRRERSNPRHDPVRTQSDSTQLAHHAKRRIAPVGKGSGDLDSFMAQLAQEGRDSDSEESAPGMHDTMSADSVWQSDDQNTLDKPTMTYGKSRGSDRRLSHTRSSFRSRSRSTSRSRSRSRPRSQSKSRSLSRSRSPDFQKESRVLFKYGKSSRSIGNPFREERLDMIDRMIVRSHPNPRRSTDTTRSKKRRRISGNQPPTKAHRAEILTHRSQYSDMTSAVHDDIELASDNEDNFDWSVNNDYEESMNSVQDGLQGIGSSHMRGSSRDNDVSDDASGSDSSTNAFTVLRREKIVQSRGFGKGKRPYGAASVPRNVASTNKPRRALCRSTVIPRVSRKRASQVSRNKKPRPSLQSRLNGAKPLQLQVAWNWNDHVSSQPQFVNKPYFEHRPKIAKHTPTRIKKAEPDLQREPEPSQLDYPSQDDPYDWDNDVNSFPSPEEMATTPSTVTMAPKQPSNSLVRPLHQSTPQSVNFLHRPPSKRIPRGLYFSRASYIGHGTLNAVLQALTLGSVAPVGQPRNRLDLFGRSLSFDYNNVPDVIEQLSQFTQEFVERNLQISQSIEQNLAVDADDLVLPSIKVLEDVTLLTLESLSVLDYHQRTEFWRLFLSRVLPPVVDLVKDSHRGPNESPGWRLACWTQWSVVVWSALASEVLLNENVTLATPIEILIGSLYNAADLRFFAHVERITSGGQASFGPVFHGADAAELWTCLVQLLNTITYQPDRSGFWTYFNRHVRQRRDLKAKSGEQEASSSSTSEAAADLVGPMHETRLIMALSVLHQFDADGSSNPDIQVQSNWELVNWLLRNKGMFELDSSTGILNSETEHQLKWFLHFTHCRLQEWNWSPDHTVVTLLYQFFAAREFRDMPLERGYRLPEFLKQMIMDGSLDEVRPESRSIENLPQLGNGTDAVQCMDAVSKLDAHDRCFEVFLKILALTLRWNVGLIRASTSIEDNFPSPVSMPRASGEEKSDFNRELANDSHLKACKRLLSTISPMTVVTITASTATDLSYSSLCNPCNLVLMMALLVPNFVRQSSVGQLRSLLNFDESDDASRRILLESVFYLGIIGQRKALSNHGSSADAAINGRAFNGILDYLFNRIDFLCGLLEQDLEDKTMYLPRSRRQTPVSSLLETALGYVTRLLGFLKDATNTVSCLPSLSYLDKRLGRILDPVKQYPPGLRLQVVSIANSFMSIRARHIDSLRCQANQQDVLVKNVSTSGVPTPGELAGISTNEDTEAGVSHLNSTDANDDFSSFEYDPMDFDDLDLLDLSQRSVEVSQFKSSDLMSDHGAIGPPEVVKLPEDEDLAVVLQSWLYPCLEKLIRDRHQELHDAQQATIRTGATAVTRAGIVGVATPFSESPMSGFMAPVGETSTAAKTTSLAQIFREGVDHILSVFADCGMFLIDQGKLDLQTILAQFRRDPWLSPTIQHARLTDEHAWATRVVQSRPWMFLENEDIFLNVWFATAGAPLHELTPQHYHFLCAILRACDIVALGNPRFRPSTSQLLSRDIFHDLPIAHRDDPKTRAGSDSRNADKTLLDTEMEAEMLREFKESRTQLLGKVIGNMGDYYLAIRPASGSTDQLKFNKAQLVKTRFLGYLGILLNQLKFDYERLEFKRLVKENIRHVELAHTVVGQVIQQGGLIIQQSYLAGTDSVLSYLTSARHFPQPQMNGVYVYQKIRGYAHLYKAGEKQFVAEFLDMLMTQLQLLSGEDKVRVDIDSYESGSKSQQKPMIALQDPRRRLGLHVVDWGVCVYTSLSHEKEQLFGRSFPRPPGATAISSLPSPASTVNRPTILTLVSGQNQRKLPARQRVEALQILTSALRNESVFELIQDHDNGDSVWSVLDGVSWDWSVQELLQDAEIISDGGTYFFRGQTLAKTPQFDHRCCSSGSMVVGCTDLMPRLYLGRLRTSLIHAMHEPVHEEDAPLRLSDGDRHSVRAMHLLGQVLRCIVSLVSIARKLRHEQAPFYERNAAWREALLELVQFAFDHSLVVMLQIGGPVPESLASDTPLHPPEPGDLGLNDNHHAQYIERESRLQDTDLDRIAGAQDGVALEATFLEFLAGQRPFKALEERVQREIHNLATIQIQSLDGWTGDILSVHSHPMETTRTRQQQQEDRQDSQQQQQQQEQQQHQQQQQQTRQWRLKRQYWSLWSFQSSFFDFCQAIAHLDARFHRQVQRGLGELLKSPTVIVRGASPYHGGQSSANAMHSLQPESDSVWYHILHDDPEPGILLSGTSGGPLNNSNNNNNNNNTHCPPLGVSSAMYLRWCLHKEWKAFLNEMGVAGQCFLGPSSYTLADESLSVGVSCAGWPGAGRVRHGMPSFSTLFL
ncbi:hypothetical protein BGZ94_010234 [Podila epigama]|nr:hypothetical protein BGZ94_010234 [Podila epigama]